MKKYVILIVSIFFAFSMNAQTAKDLFSQKFPEYNSALSPKGSTNVTDANISQFRNLYKKLATALQEVDMFKFGGFPEDGGEIFTSKELKGLKKDGQLEKFEELIKVSINDMKIFLGTKHKWGADSIDCIQKYSNFKTRLKQKDYKGSCEYWRELNAYYPKSFSGIYSKGEKLIKKKIQMVHNEAAKVGKEAVVLYNEKKFDESKVLQDKQKELLAEKELWIDTLLIIVDNRMLYFGKSKNYGKGYLFGKKGGFIYKYRKDSAYDEAYKYLKQSVELEKDKTQPSRMKDFFDASMDMTKNEKNGAEELVNDYNLATSLLNTSIEKLSSYIEKEKAKPEAKQKPKKIKSWTRIVEASEKVSKYITSKFASSDYSKCEYLVPAFKKTFEENKSNADWLEKKLGILKWKECTNDPFFLEAAKALYQLKPSASAAAMIAIGELKKKNYAEAGKYFEEAYNGETEDMDKKAEYYYYGAVVASAQNQKSKARTLALKASSTKENYGKPYLLIARLYAGSASSCGSTKFEKAAVYWAAVDKLVKARSLTTDQKVKDEANQFISKYSNRFPSSEEGFMLGKYKGNPYSIGCWIGETTTVRYNK